MADGQVAHEGVQRHGLLLNGVSPDGGAIRERVWVVDAGWAWAWAWAGRGNQQGGG